jgi:hypothetical protein
VLSDLSMLALHRAFSSFCASSGLHAGGAGKPQKKSVAAIHLWIDGERMRKGRGESIRSDCGATASRRRRCGDEKEHNNLARVLWFFCAALCSCECGCWHWGIY